MARTLILDIETSPHIAYVWGLWKQNVGLNQIHERTRILSFSSKWLDEPEKNTFMIAARTEKDEEVLLHHLYHLLNEADVVVTHNGKKFDTPVILSRLVVHGFPPPSPFHQVDTCQVAKSEFRFASNSLENIAIELGIRKKSGHKKYPGFELWLGCLRDEDEAWAELLKYNAQDVYVLEDVYLKLRPYMRGHPNVVRNTEGMACPKCGGTHLQMRGTYVTSAGINYQRFQCQGCGGWGRSRTIDKDAPRNDGRNAR